MHAYKTLFRNEKTKYLPKCNFEKKYESFSRQEVIRYAKKQRTHLENRIVYETMLAAGYPSVLERHVSPGEILWDRSSPVRVIIAR